MSSRSTILGVLVIIASNPILLAITVVVGFVFLAFGIGFIVYYNLATAIMFLVISGGAIVLLNYIGVLKIKEHPLLFAIPIVLALVGYGGQNLKFSINGQETALLDASIAINPNAANPVAWVLLEVLIAILAIVGIGVMIKKIRK